MTVSCGIVGSAGAHGPDQGGDVFRPGLGRDFAARGEDEAAPFPEGGQERGGCALDLGGALLVMFATLSALAHMTTKSHQEGGIHRDEVGTADVYDGSRTVRYLSRDLTR